MKTKDVLIKACFLVGWIRLSSASYVHLTQDGYENVVVNIAESVALVDCHEALQNVQNGLREMSHSLGQGLDNAAVSFANVIIVIPNQWNQDPNCRDLIANKAVPWTRVHKADINIVPDHPVFGAQSYSFQYGACGQPGLPIQCPLTLITDDVTARGKRLAKEWAHYRYGVYDEGGVPYDIRHPSGYHIYRTDGSLIAEPNICSNTFNFKGQLNNDSCPDVAAPGCELILDQDNPNIFSSLMYRPDLSQMNKFCTKESHNRAAPSKQNFFCNGLSASEVIYQHDDFKNHHFASEVSELTETSFTVISDPFTGYHIIIDPVSFDEPTFVQAKKSISSFISLLPIGLWISIDSFDSSSSVVVQERVLIEDENTRNLVLKILDTVTYKGPDLKPKGFAEALSNARQKAEMGQDVIVLTALRSAPDTNQFERVLHEFHEQKVNVHLLCFQSQTSEYVKVAELTSYGSFYLIPRLDSDDPWSSALVWSVAALQSIYSSTHIFRDKIFEETLDFSTTSSATGTFYLDGDASALVVCIYSIDDADLDLFDDVTFSLGEGQAFYVDHDQLMGVYTYHNYTSISKGLWQYQINALKKNKATKVRVDVWVENDGTLTDLIELRTWNSAVDNQVVDWTKQPMVIFAELTQNRKPISGAHVAANVYVADARGYSTLNQQIILTDQALPDVTGGDGIYSGWIGNVSATSLTYSIHYVAYGVEGLAQVDSGKYERAPTTAGYITKTAAVSAVTQFNRMGYGPSLMVQSRAQPSIDVIPPQRITDLNIAGYNPSTGQVNLTWSPPLDDFGLGSVVDHFIVWQRIDERDAERVSDPAAKFILQDDLFSWNVQLPQLTYGSSVYYTVQGMDDAHNIGNPSNMVSLVGAEETGLSVVAWVFIGLAIALVLLIIALLLVCWFFPHKTQRLRSMVSCCNKEDDQDEQESLSSDWRIPTPWTSKENTTEKECSQQRHYFGMDDIESMRESEEIIVRRVPSIDLQLSTVLKNNSSNLDLYDDKEAHSVDRSAIYATPFAHDTSSTLSADEHHQMPMTSHIFYTDIPIHSSSSITAGAKHTHHQSQNSIPGYGDPRLDSQLKLQDSTFDPKMHPANRNGLPSLLQSGHRTRRVTAV